MDKTLEALVAEAIGICEEYVKMYGEYVPCVDIERWTYPPYVDSVAEQLAAAMSAINTHHAAEGGEAEGCLCQRCGQRYKVDVLVPDALWMEISPKPVDGWRGGGLLCGPCIIQQLEKRGYAAYRLDDLSQPSAPSKQPLTARTEAANTLEDQPPRNPRA